MPVYALGSNGSGQLGIGHEEDVSEPTEVTLPSELDGSSIESIMAGGNHTLILSKLGDVYAAGSKSMGKCGLYQHESKDSSFRRVQTQTASGKSHKIALCVATWDASIFATTDGRLLVSGAGSKGELGLGIGHVECESPTEIRHFPPASTLVTDLTACMGHVVVVLSNGEAYGWGQGRKGQLGEPEAIVWEPRRIESIPFPVHRAICGKDFTVFFSKPDLGQLHILGPNKRDTYNLRSNTPEKLSPWLDVHATWGSIYVHNSCGSVLAWGRNDHGQLPPRDLTSIIGICAGSEHVLASTTSGQVLTWGWGEHGNCGLPLDNQKDVKDGRWNTLHVPGRVLKLGAGCATSWIVTSDADG